MFKITVKELKNICRENKFRGFSKLTKAELIDVILCNHDKWGLSNYIVKNLEDLFLEKIDDILFRQLEELEGDHTMVLLVLFESLGMKKNNY
ncbi:hypothetical protein [Dasineura jujubifolia toursvirus 2a]|nr:hypothetical protein [Dasineura jujubifolia toursvirus 2a]